MEDSQSEEFYDTIIIGCGMAGLAAGIRLALFDKRVLILEAHNVPGGLNSFYYKEGRKFDVGLHAVTNYPKAGVRGSPMGKLFRQLRLPSEVFEMAPQNGSRIAFPGKNLCFTNDFSDLEASVAEIFPREIDRFRKLREAILSHDALNLEATPSSAREMVRGYLDDPLLEDMLFCPLMFYGSASEEDMELDQFVTMWRAIFEEGFGRPSEGIRIILRVLLNQYRSLGGKRRMRCPVRKILLKGGRAIGVELESGETISAGNIISTAGSVETQVLCGAVPDEPRLLEEVGRLSFVETISVLSETPRELGCPDTIIFFNDSERFNYQQSVEPVDLRSGLVCFPGNYQYPSGDALSKELIRITMIANYDTWTGYSEETYAKAKEEWFLRMTESGLRFVPGLDLAEIQGKTVYRDMFTPRTIEKYTAHRGGAIYGSPRKHKNGLTEYRNLYLAGTDQGFLGIVGAMLSGITMANRHVLMGDK